MDWAYWGERLKAYLLSPDFLQPALVLLGILLFLFAVYRLLARLLFGKPANKKIKQSPAPAPTKAEHSQTSHAVPSYPAQAIKCQKCDGHYVERWGPYGVFAGCSNFPNCKSTLKFREYIKRVIKSQGIKIYAWDKVCWNCGQTTKVYSYYLNISLHSYLPILQQFPIIGLGDIPALDAHIAKKYPSIKPQYSRTSRDSYYANTCEHCHKLQGYNYVVTEPDEIWDDFMDPDCHINMEKYLLSIIFIEDDAIVDEVASAIAQE